MVIGERQDGSKDTSSAVGGTIEARGYGQAGMDGGIIYVWRRQRGDGLRLRRESGEKDAQEAHAGASADVVILFYIR